mgnify:CR=1 FL=1
MTGITLSASQSTIYVKVTPSNATNKAIRWQIVKNYSPREFDFIITESDNNHCVIGFDVHQEFSLGNLNYYVIVRSTSADGPSNEITVTLRDIIGNIGNN